MKNVMLYAYTYFNLGDDLFIKLIAERYPDTQFMLVAPKAYKHAFKERHNIRILPSDTIIRRGIHFMFKTMGILRFSRPYISKNCDAAVLIGGSLFIQGQNWRETMKMTKAMPIKGKPFFLLGANFGPFHEQEFYQEHKYLFQHYTDICFRDTYSYELFNDLNHVRVADDIVFHLQKQTTQKSQDDGYIVITVIKPSIRENLSGYDAMYYTKIKDIAIYFMDKGYPVTFMSFCAFEADEEAIIEIMQKISPNYASRITTYAYKYHIDEALRIIARSTFVIASRFHAMILGWVYQKPVFPIVYSDKMKHVMVDLDFNGSYIDMDNVQKLTAEQVYMSMETNSQAVRAQVKNAEKQFEKLDAYLLQ
ncbi:polysaccharide pyruvyl transferase family protein [Virgibacillus sp. NKC19-3]|uniref:polysaccharide pyruvyl transferase family protein n=1 Tax=Virgibacillus saliphilus TaxID=2831674 RepID=UPI001C9B49C3|nr:polysaccharide pyruvyl transferase family protein [Virgibacillus sp. NKC19-3]MBY7144644.1 polysaccharide pyruvyl transferase family protein [Virgibacillus sp. NKC19-3]